MPDRPPSAAVWHDKPITKLKAVLRGDGVTVLKGSALCYTMALS